MTEFISPEYQQQLDDLAETLTGKPEKIGQAVLPFVMNADHHYAPDPGYKLELVTEWTRQSTFDTTLGREL